MASESLSPGMPWQIAQNTAYALPACQVMLHSTAAVELSIDGTLWVASATAHTTGMVTAAAFVRCTTGASNVICKRA